MDDDVTDNAVRAAGSNRAGSFRKIDSIHDQMQRVVTYELGDGRRIRMDERAVAEYGVRAILEDYGYRPDPPTALPVLQSGRLVGSLSSDFDPQFAKSRSPFYRVRPGDFRREGNQWVASPSLGPADLSAAGVRCGDERDEADIRILRQVLTPDDEN